MKSFIKKWESQVAVDKNLKNFKLEEILNLRSEGLKVKSRKEMMGEVVEGFSHFVNWIQKNDEIKLTFGSFERLKMICQKVTS